MLAFNEILRSQISKMKADITPIGPEGPWQPGGPNSQLPFRNLLSYDAQTL